MTVAAVIAPAARRRRWPPVAVLGALGFLAVLVVVAVLAPVIAPHPPGRVAMGKRLTPPVFSGGTWTHPLGTDSLGQDLLSRTMFGARVSLLVGVCAVLLSGTMGVTLGLISGYRGGWLDDVIMRIAEIQLAFPAILLYIAAMATLGPGLWKIIVVIGVVGWVSYARIERGVVLAVRGAGHGGAGEFDPAPAHLAEYDGADHCGGVVFIGDDGDY